jgi:2'-5' RNA ligase
VRLFAAIDLSHETRDAMAAEQERIAASLGSTAAPLKWVRPDHAHLTLVFLGQVDDTRVPALVDAVGMNVDAQHSTWSSVESVCFLVTARRGCCGWGSTQADRN